MFKFIPWILHSSLGNIRFWVFLMILTSCCFLLKLPLSRRSLLEVTDMAEEEAQVAPVMVEETEEVTTMVLRRDEVLTAETTTVIITKTEGLTVEEKETDATDQAIEEEEEEEKMEDGVEEEEEQHAVKKLMSPWESEVRTFTLPKTLKATESLRFHV